MGSSAGDEEEAAESTLRGLVGLQNLGNTCYMNGALQALSNCQQLTRFVLDCPEFLRERGLSHSYSELMREMWIEAGRSHCAVPASIIRNIKCIYPAFRGCSQQDSQEFLRCFLEQLHDELKQPPAPVSWSRRSKQLANNSIGRPATAASATLSNPTIAKQQQQQQQGDTTATELASATIPTTTPIDVQDVARQPTAPAPESAANSRPASRPTASDDANARSIISDTFEFRIASSVVCSCCNNISTTIETFKDLSIPIVAYPAPPLTPPLPLPTAPTRVAGARTPGARNQHRVTGASNAAATATITTTKQQQPSQSDSKSDTTSCAGQAGVGQELQTSNSYLSYLPIARWFWSWLGYLNDWICGPKVTLQDCLTIFFGTDPLEGDNEYSCEVCTKKNRGVKFLRISELPEVLCIHFKRYESVGSAKITTHVSFPLTGLDLSEFMSQESRPQCTTYNLIACICHHGNALLTGHYTTFALNCYDNQWYEFDDQLVTSVDERQVERSEAYILFYQKSTLDDKVDRQRVKASQLHKKSLLQTLNHQHQSSEQCADGQATGIAETPASGSNIKKYFISKLWISKFNTFVEPGPINNYDFLCHHRRVPRKLEPFLKDLCHPVSKMVWRYLKRLHGGGPVCRQLESCQLCE